jgi:ATP/maltotriose-dependent transcriptional regulator MalT
MGFQLYYWARAVLAFGLNDEENAHCHVQEALQLAHQESSVAIEIALLPSAAYALASAQPARAVQLLAWANHSNDSATLWIKQWARVARLRAELQNQLGAAAFEREWKRGAALEWGAVLAILLEEFQDAPATINSFLQSPLDQLTARELDVLYLLATGLTNPQIADQLVIGIGTVKTHTLNIYRKLDVANRSQAIIRAQELGLLPV